MKRVAILQSNYIPWKGYFDIIGMVDLFIFHDDLQYTKNDWRNRNKIKTPNGVQWLTIPCGTSENRLICDVTMKDYSWQRKHWSVISQNYRKAPFFEHYKSLYEEFFLSRQWDYLSKLNQYIIMKISKEVFGFDTEFGDSREYNLTKVKEERVIELLTKAKADVYLSGPSAKNYISEQVFNDNNIQIEWMDYSGYPKYPQQYGEFVHGVTVLDLIFNVGANAIDNIKARKA